jgi:putative acetyltransferase
MQIREAALSDAENIRKVHLQAFEPSEARIVADLAVNLLNEKSPIKIISLVAIQKDEIVGHIAFSPVYLEANNEHFAYILAPLAVSPQHQKNNIGSSLMRHGLDTIANIGAFIVFVYGDPQYYSRFGFSTDLARKFTPQHSLQYPEGWQALKINSSVFPEGGAIICVDSLNDPDLW